MTERDYHTDNKSFIVFKDWEILVESLNNDEEVGRLFKGLFAFAKRGEQPQFEGALKMAFLVMSAQIARDGEKWEETCSKRQENIKKRWEKRADTNVYSCIPNDTKHTDTDTDTDTVTVMDIDTATDTAINSMRSAPSKPAHQTYGTYNHVLLTKEQHSKLITDYGESLVTDYIMRVDAYCEKSGKVYQNYDLTIRSWINEDEAKRKRKETPQRNNTSSFDVRAYEEMALNIDPSKL